MFTRPQILVVVLALVLYLPALAYPAIQVDEGGPKGCTTAISRLGTVGGLAALLFGWIPPMTLPWAANPVLLAAALMLLCGRARSATRLGILAVLLGFTTWGCHWMLGWKEVCSGYYLWQASTIVFTAGAATAWAWQAGRQPIVLDALPADEEGREVEPVVSSVRIRL